ncbi:MAG: peptide MFS transporter [Cyclobacteriaceae bacterium]|nr:peptide MFS transporter [Cyclobacteriaceae bacterium]MCH8515960.1 peptide MFS transporter [Cyclobacteriaceae bacterium]
MDNAIKKDEVFGHPKGLFYLFFAELWERFSFYGMRALLILYMVNALFEDMNKGVADKLAFAIYGGYGALVYFTPVIGGIIADRYLGYRRAIMLGAILFVLGHFVLAIEHPVFFYGALALIIVGNGFFKPNISSLVGSLYERGDKRRDTGFTIFYMGINMGAATAPLVCDWLGRTYGYHYGFGAAGVGMLLGLIVFYFGNRSTVFGDRGFAPSEPLLNEKYLGLKRKHLITLLAFLTVPVFALMLYVYEYKVVADVKMVDIIGSLQAIIILAVLYVIGKTFLEVSKVEKQRLIVVMLLTFFMTVFWAFFELSGSALTLFAERNVDLPSWMGAAATNFINPFFIIVFAVPFSALWTYLSKIKANPITPIKFALGLGQLGLSFFVFAMSINYADESGQVPFLFLWLGYMFMTTGELFLSPVGLSKVTELSPLKIVGFMMGVWFLSSSFAHFISAQIAKLTAIDEMDEIMTDLSQVADPMVGLAAYTDTFQLVAYVALGFGFLALLLSPIIKKWMHGVH